MSMREDRCPHMRKLALAARGWMALVLPFLGGFRLNFINMIY